MKHYWDENESALYDMVNNYHSAGTVHSKNEFPVVQVIKKCNIHVKIYKCTFLRNFLIISRESIFNLYHLHKKS